MVRCCELSTGAWDASRWWRHSLDEQSRSQSSMDDSGGSGSDSPEPGGYSDSVAGGRGKHFPFFPIYIFH